MIFISVAFDYGDTQYIRLMDVLSKSIYKNCPKAKQKMITIPAPVVNEEERAELRFGEHTAKLQKWVELLNEEDDDEIIFIDADTFVLRDVSHVFLEDFDLGITRRTGEPARIPFNGGVLFVKKNERTLLFFDKFLEINNKMFEDKIFHQEWRDKYAGMNQAAFGWMYENYEEDINIMELPCALYNACGMDWKNFTIGKPYIVHVKSKLRKIILDNNNNIAYKDIADSWREIENGSYSGQ